MWRFLLTIVPLAALLRAEFVIDHLRLPYCEWLARSLNGFFWLVGMSVRRVDASLYSPDGRGLTIIPECDGLILLALFTAGVVAVPRQPSFAPYRRALGALGFLVVLNWLRLLVLAVAAFYFPAAFEWMHGYGVQGVLVLGVAAVFFLWLERLTPEDTGTGRDSQELYADASS